MKHHLLVDAHGIGYAAQESAPLSVGGMPVQAVFGVVRKVRELAAEGKYTSIRFLWDGKTSWRNAAFPGYKANRQANPALQEMRREFRQQVPLIKEALLYMGVHQYYSVSSEADDLAGLIAREFSGQGDRVTLLTTDKDWLQLIDDLVTWRGRSDDKLVTPKNFVSETSCLDARQFIEYKALRGDTSDCIPGVGGIGEKGAHQLLAQYRSVVSLVKRFRAGDIDPASLSKNELALVNNDPHPKEDGMGRLDVFARNVKLITLRVGSLPSDLVTLRRPQNFQRFQSFCEAQNFRSILENFEFFIEPIKNLE